jgi:Flp pilus assembly pilin Flp
MRSRTRPDPARRPGERLIGLGQGIVEYGLILGLSAILTVVLLVFFGGTLSVVLQAVGDAIDAAS